MLTTTIFGFKKPQTTDNRSFLRSTISDNADLLEALLDRRGYAEVLTSESTSSGTTTDLTTVGPSVTLAVPAGGVIEFHCNVRMSPASAAGLALVRIDVSGTDFGAVLQAQATSGGQNLDGFSAPGAVPVITPSTILNQSTSGWSLITGPTRNTRFTAGTYTIKMRYQTTAGMSSAFSDRMLWARVRTF